MQAPGPARRLRTATSMAGAVVVDVLASSELAPLELADHRAAAVAALDEAGEGELVAPPLGPLGVAPVEDVLDPFS